MRKFLKYSCAFLLGAAILTGCAAQGSEIATLPISEGTTPVFTAREETAIESADAFAAAIAPGAVVELGAGTIDLGKGIHTDTPYCRWAEVDDGTQLVISNVDNLTIRGTDTDLTGLVTTPRRATVLTFENCKNLTLENFNAGHTQMAEACQGYVLYFQNCENVNLRGLGIYGCGFQGIVAEYTGDLTVENSDIYSCSNTGVTLFGCTGAKLKNCRIYSIGTEKTQDGVSGYTALCAYGSGDVTLEKCAITDNCMENIIATQGTQVRLVDCSIRNNRLEGTGFVTGSMEDWGGTDAQGTISLSGCTGEGNDGWSWLRQAGDPNVTNETGQALTEEAVAGMLGTLYEQAAAPTTPQEEVTVTDAEEFAAAIGSNRKIIVDTDLLDLSQLGEITQDFCYLQEVFDGVQLVIHGVDNLTIVGKDGKDVNVISALPRYAQVLSFYKCSNIALEGLTIGHTKEPGYCVGGVLWFDQCSNVRVEKCGLYGCGTIGVQAYDSRGIQIQNNDIYECSYGGIMLSNTNSASMDGNTFRDLGDEYGGYIYQVFSDCADVTFNGKRITPGSEEPYVK